jgi:hypothetical protein
VADFFGRYLTRKVAIAAAAIAAFSALTVALLAALSALLAGIVSVVPEGNPYIITGMWVVLPHNALACVSAALAADSAVFLYRWNAKIVDLAAYS